MKLWHISQDENIGYDTYSDAVVAAKTGAAARRIHPDGRYEWNDEDGYSTWVPSPDLVKVKCIGMARKGTKPGIICASYHAG